MFFFIFLSKNGHKPIRRKVLSQHCTGVGRGKMCGEQNFPTLMAKVVDINKGPVHTIPNKFKNGVFAPKTDKMFSVHTIVFVPFSTGPEQAKIETAQGHHSSPH